MLPGPVPGGESPFIRASAGARHTMTSKHTARSRGRAARLSLSGDKREDASLQIARHVLHSPQWRRAGAIGIYLSTDEEVSTWSLIDSAWRMGKRLYAPVVRPGSRLEFVRLTPKTRLSRHRFGMLEPESDDALSCRRLDLVIAPVVAFDSHGNRVGMGGGYYDRAFAFLRHRRRFFRPKLVGLAFAAQGVEDIETNATDVPLIQLYTELGSALRPDRR